MIAVKLAQLRRVWGGNSMGGGGMMSSDVGTNMMPECGGGACGAELLR
jgi:hypothetical protein